MGGRIYSDDQKQHFFELIDRGGTVRAAATAAGVHPAAAYTWLRQAGLTMQRASPRRYSAEEKAEFFRLVAIHQNVAKVADMLGFTRVTCYAWAHKAGIFTSTNRSTNPRRERFLQLRAAGMTRAQAREAVGADKRSATDWDKGITIVNRGRIYPDGRRVDYPLRTLERMQPVRTARAIGGRIDLDHVEKVIHPRYLSLTERELLADLLQQGLSIRQIARQMHRSPSTVSREVRRNTASTRGYLPHTAHRRSAARRRRPHRQKLLVNHVLRQAVVSMLSEDWSPEQISRRLPAMFPQDPAMRACPETIYQAIYRKIHPDLGRECGKHLRRGRPARRNHQRTDRRRARFVENMVSIHLRPPEITHRTSLGHWEGDLVVGAGNRSAVITLVERSSRFLLLAPLGTERTAEHTLEKLVGAIGPLPAELRGSLTWDQGAEMAEHAAFTAITGIPVYFCDPASPWQRGSNENTNGLLRQYLPKGTSLAHHDHASLNAIAQRLNNRPRKTLNWQSPTERLAALLDPSHAPLRR